MNIVILDGFSVTQHDLDWTPLSSSLPGATLTVYDRTAPADTLSRCAQAEAVLTNKVVLTADIITQLPRLRYIGVLATGYNVVDCEAARKQGIVVTNIPAYSTDSVAQLVFAHLLNVVNSVAHYAERRNQWPLAQDFTWSDTPLTELAGKTFGIYGLGAIGNAVARIARAFGMNVIAVTSKTPQALPQGVESVTFEQLLERADVVSLHCPLTATTRLIINAETLQLMRPSAILINTGRGPLVDDQAVAQALCQGRIAAYCAVVLTTEPPSPDNPLLKAPRCFITPHIAWATREARSRLIDIATTNLRAFTEGKPINQVNAI